MRKNDSGFLVLDKPQGITSQGAVSQVKKILGLKKAGHTGTLDPLATGVLPIALGEATKVICFLDESLKTYRVTAKLGSSTDSYDAAGRTLQTREVGPISRQILFKILTEFLGESLQRPPLYSAIKVRGRPLYRYAREGKEIEVKPRKILISELILESLTESHVTLKVQCSRGTYIRTLVHDLGVSLGCLAHVVELRRLATGPFHLESALNLSFLQDRPEALREKILSIEDCLAGLPAINLVSEEEVKKIHAGAQLPRVAEDLILQGLTEQVVALKFDREVVAFIRGRKEGDFHYHRVLNRS